MLKNISRILPFFIVTLLSIGSVELIYGIAEHQLFDVKPSPVAAKAAVTSQPSKIEQIKQHQNYQVILERNLFKSFLKTDEKKEEVKENPLEGLEVTSLDLVLMGTITGLSENSRRAFIMEKTKRKQEIYYEGDDIQGASVKEILRGKVILTFQGKDEILDMSEASKMRPKVAANKQQPPQRRIVPNTKTPKKRVVSPKRRIISRRAATSTNTRTIPPGQESGSDSDGDNISNINETQESDDLEENEDDINVEEIQREQAEIEDDDGILTDENGRIIIQE